jgi:Na+-transporting methylmalonyl-CoA/oxaloacetate decarboxylase gamma subunit
MAQPPVAGSGCGKGCIVAAVLVFFLGVAAVIVFLFVLNRVVDTATKLVGDIPVPPANGITEKKGKLDACKLLTKDDVAPMLGTDVTVESSGTDCNFTSTQGTSFVQVTYEFGNHDDFLYEKQLYSSIGKFVGGAVIGVPTEYAAAGGIIGGQSQDIKGLGDEAFWNGAFLGVRKGDKLVILYGFTFQLTGTPTSSSLDLLKGIAQKALSKI